MVGRRSCYTRGERPTVRNYGRYLLFGSVRFGCIPEVGCRLPIRQTDEPFIVVVRFGSVPNRKLIVVAVQMFTRSVVVVQLSCSCSAILPRTPRT